MKEHQVNLNFFYLFFVCSQDVIVNHATSMVKGMLSLLQSCPKEVAHLRKELLIAARHILATDLRNSKFTMIKHGAMVKNT